MSSFLLSNLCYWCLEFVWIDYVWVVLLARLHLVLGHGYCYTIVTMPGFTNVNEFLFWDNTNTQQACITIEPWENKTQETAIFFWINPWCITNFTGSMDLVIKWDRELLTRFSQGETWLLDWGCQWAGGHQTLVFFFYDNSIEFPLINQHQTLQVGTSYQNTRWEWFWGQLDCKILAS